jgi:hypothetical protein
MLYVALLFVSFCNIITDEPVAKRRRTDGKNAAARFSSDYDRPLHGSGSSGNCVDVEDEGEDGTGTDMLLKAPPVAPPPVAFMPRVSHSGKSSMASDQIHLYCLALTIHFTGDINAPPGLTASADVLKDLLRKLLQVCMF